MAETRSGGADRPPASSVVLGLGGCIDYEIRWDQQMLQLLVDQYALRRADLDRTVTIDSERDLVRSLVSHLADGVGGESYVASGDVVREFAARCGYRETLGGTNVRAAAAMARVGVPSTLHLVSIDDTFRRLLPPEVSWVCSATQDTTAPHLIIQFPTGATIRLVDATIVAPSANRLIYVNDPASRELILSPELGRMASTATALLISGLNSIQDETVLAARLEDLTPVLRAVPDNGLILYEDAGYHAYGMGDRVLQSLSRYLDVCGMNEDEWQTRIDRRIDLLDAADVRAALDELRTAIEVPTVVIHTRYWVLAAGERAAEFRSGLEYGIALSAARYLHGDEFAEADIAALSDHPRDAGGVEVAKRLDESPRGEICCVPGFSLATASPTTIGLGDTFVGGFLVGTLDPVRPTAAPSL